MTLSVVPAVFPSGVYKFIVYAFTNDESVLTANIIASVNSPNKDTFG